MASPCRTLIYEGATALSEALNCICCRDGLAAIKLISQQKLNVLKAIKHNYS